MSDENLPRKKHKTVPAIITRARDSYPHFLIIAIILEQAYRMPPYRLFRFVGKMLRPLVEKFLEEESVKSEASLKIVSLCCKEIRTVHNSLFFRLSSPRNCPPHHPHKLTFALPEGDMSRTKH
ncbi:hypothetical protein NQ315_000401 [Exocentrus adspersus]|uniref:Uncharacterized protein n=1 Tax=Exocentrus adspersus TaxID=1586481 RepID=A0AAV8VMA4_9CUCU|nr:hypothetical protein NQ315_000401 [Exocentrus adspersus]